MLILPAMGIVAEIIANNTRKPLWGYKALVYSVIFLGFMSFIVWAHHMFMTGMGTTMSAFFQTTTMIISIPSVVILTALLLSLWGASIRFTTPMLFALAFLPMFGIGGLTGLPLGLAPSDIHLHDTYYVIGHFHYVVAPGTIFALFAGIYYWFPKATGRKMNEMLGAIHFWGSFICINIVFMPMFIQGLGGMNRRMYDGGMQYAHNAEPAEVERRHRHGGVDARPVPASVHHQLLREHQVGQGGRQEPVGGDHARVVGAVAARTRQLPDRADRLPRPVRIQRAGRGARTSRRSSSRRRRSRRHGTFRTPSKSGPTPGWPTASSGIWLFLASEVMLFGALFSTYIILRVGAPEWPHGELNVWLGMVNTVILIGSSVTMVMAWASLKLNDWGKHRLYLHRHVPAGRRLPRQQVLRVRGPLDAAARCPGTARSSRSTSR